MRLLAAGGHVVALFGAGLIGSAIEQALRRRGQFACVAHPYSWLDPALRRAELIAIEGAITRALTPRPAQGARCSIVWAAGVSGFGSTPAQMETERSLVAELCAAAEDLAHRQPGLEIGFHLVSSAGGLYEGQTQVGRHTAPSPLRPYGVGKLEQERMVRAMAPRIRTEIYRPASVYGFRPGARRGLFATLIMNALTNRPSLISGAARTIRDYILARDIGEFVTRKLLDPAPAEATHLRAPHLLAPHLLAPHLLASGKPTTMFEVIAAIESLVRRPLYRRFEPRATNALDLSFAPSALPPDLAITPLPVGLARLEANIRTHVMRQSPSILR